MNDEKQIVIDLNEDVEYETPSTDELVLLDKTSSWTE